MLALALTTVLASSPQPARTVSLSAKLDVGALVGSGWYVPQTKDQMMLALFNARDSFLVGDALRFDPMLHSTPVVGAWVMAADARGYDQAMLITSGALQLLGTVVAIKRLLLDESDGVTPPVGPQLTISPIVAGQLGVGVRLTNF